MGFYQDTKRGDGVGFHEVAYEYLESAKRQSLFVYLVDVFLNYFLTAISRFVNVISVSPQRWRTQDERLAPLTSPKLEALGPKGDD